MFSNSVFATKKRISETLRVTVFKLSIWPTFRTCWWKYIAISGKIQNGGL